MNRNSFHWLSVISLGIILGAGGGIFLEVPPVMGAGETQQNQEAEKQAIQALIEQEINAINSEDIQAMQNNYHPNSSEFNQKKPHWEKLFQEIDMKTELNKLEFLKIAENEASVKITVTSLLIGANLDYKEQKTTVVSKLQKYQGRWKFFSSEIDFVYRN